MRVNEEAISNRAIKQILMAGLFIIRVSSSGGGGEGPPPPKKKMKLIFGTNYNCFNSRRMFVLQKYFFNQRSKVKKVNNTFLPEGIQIEDLTLASCHAL